MKEEIVNKSYKRSILLNPGPATTSPRVKSALITSDICPREKEFGDLTQEVNTKILKVVNATHCYRSIMFGCSGTGAIEAVLGSVSDKSSDDKILIIENGAYGKRMGIICEALDIPYSILKTPWNNEINWEDIEQLLQEQGQDFQAIAFVHHETTTGRLNSLERFYQIANKYALVSIVDAMSSYAGIHIDLQETPVDYLISSSNKCIHGMAGLGIVIVQEKELERIKSFPKRSLYFNLYESYRSQSEKEQFAFTPPVQILYALNEALDEFFEKGGITKRVQQYESYYQMIYQGMIDLGFTPLLKDEDNSKVLTTFFEPQHQHYSFEKMHDFFYQQGITIYPGKVSDQNTFRISNIGELTCDDIRQFLALMKKYLHSLELQ